MLLRRHTYRRLLKPDDLAAAEGDEVHEIRFVDLAGVLRAAAHVTEHGDTVSVGEKPLRREELDVLGGAANPQPLDDARQAVTCARGGIKRIVGLSPFDIRLRRARIASTLPRANAA